MVEPIHPDDQPIVVDPSAKVAMLVTALRQIALVVGGAGTVIGFAKGHDIKGALDYVLSSDFAVAMSAIATIAVFVYGQFRVIWDRRKLITVAGHVDDRVAIVLGLPFALRIRAFFARIRRIF